MPTTDKAHPGHDLAQRTAVRRRRAAVTVIESLLLVAAILVYLGITAQSYLIDCQRDADGVITCSLRDTVLGVITLQERTVEAMAAAAVEDSCDGATCLYRLELYDSQGVPVPVEEEYTPGSLVKQRMAKMLNEFAIDSTRTGITMRSQVNWMVYMLPVVAVGVFVLYKIRQKAQYERK